MVLTISPAEILIPWCRLNPIWHLEIHQLIRVLTDLAKNLAGTNIGSDTTASCVLLTFISTNFMNFVVVYFWCKDDVDATFLKLLQEMFISHNTQTTFLFTSYKSYVKINWWLSTDSWQVRPLQKFIPFITYPHLVSICNTGRRWVIQRLPRKILAATVLCELTGVHLKKTLLWKFL